MNRNLLLIMILVALIQGCVSIPQSYEEFKSGEYSFQEVCSSTNVMETHAHLKNELTACYKRTSDAMIPVAGAFVFINSGTDVEAQLKDDGTATLSLPGFQNGKLFGYQQLIEIFPTDNCPAMVRVYELSASWKRHTERVWSWLEGSEVKGCGIW